MTTPLVNEHNFTIGAQLNRPVQTLNLFQVRQQAPSVFATEPYPGMSYRYAFIPTIQIVERLLDEGWAITKAMESYVRLPDKMGFAKHMLRFRRLDNKLPLVGDTVMEIVLTNAHDGSSCFVMDMGLYRYLCSNGLIVSNGHLDSVRMMHKGDAGKNVIEGTYRVIDELPAIEGTVKRWQSMDLNPKDRQMMALGAARHRWGTESLPIEPPQLLVARRPQDRDPTLWNTYNTLQENLVKGGLYGKARTGRRMTTRGINSVDSDVGINKQLWRMGEFMEEFKNVA